MKLVSPRTPTTNGSASEGCGGGAAAASFPTGGADVHADYRFAQSKKYDLEAWMPATEPKISSCSNFEDFQACANIRSQGTEGRNLSNTPNGRVGHRPDRGRHHGKPQQEDGSILIRRCFAPLWAAWSGSSD